MIRLERELRGSFRRAGAPRPLSKRRLCAGHPCPGPAAAVPESVLVPSPSPLQPLPLARIDAGRRCARGTSQFQRRRRVRTPLTCTRRSVIPSLVDTALPFSVFDHVAQNHARRERERSCNRPGRGPLEPLPLSDRGRAWLKTRRTRWSQADRRTACVTCIRFSKKECQNILYHETPITSPRVHHRVIMRGPLTNNSHLGAHVPSARLCEPYRRAALLGALGCITGAPCELGTDRIAHGSGFAVSPRVDTRRRSCSRAMPRVPVVIVVVVRRFPH